MTGKTEMAASVREIQRRLRGPRRLWLLRLFLLSGLLGVVVGLMAGAALTLLGFPWVSK